MKTVDKALKLLDFFTVQEPEWGLSDLARAASLEKATTLRMLAALDRYGLLEQHPTTKKYRLGKAVLKLARVREASFPFASIVQPALEKLVEETGESAHVALASGPALMTVAIAEPQRSTRVCVDPSKPLPYHATASGIACLAYASENKVQHTLGTIDLSAYTEHTLTTPGKIRRQIAEVRQRGYAVSARSFEMEVIGIAAPIFDWTGYACGAVAVASIASRMTPDMEAAIARAVVNAAVDVTRATGAEPQAAFLETMDELAA